jgi:predicted Zn finger-like uncharacterized protein
MALRVRCPNCSLDYTLSDDLRGKRVRCKQCREAFTADEAGTKSGPEEPIVPQEAQAADPQPEPATAVPEQERSRPRRRPRDEEDDERDRPRRSAGQSSGLKTTCVIGGIISGTVLLMFFGCLGFCLLLPWRATPNTAGVIVQGGNPPVVGPQNPPQNPGPGPGGNVPPVAPKPPEPKPAEPKPAEPKVVTISARQLGQELFDESSKAFERYAPSLLQVVGVVRKQSNGPDGSITEVVFLEPVTDRKSSAAKEYTIWCRFGTPLAPGGKAAEQAAVGKTVTVRGRMTGAGVGPQDPQATLNECVLVGAPDGGKSSPVPEKPPVPKSPPLVRWQVQPDPLPADLTLPEKAEGRIPITGYPPLPNNVVDQVVFPTTPSPFVTVAVKGKRSDAHEVWDLRTMKRVGVVDPQDPFTRASLSPDGAWFAVPTFGIPASPGADVFAVADGRLHRVTVSTDRNRSCDNIDFAGPGQLLTFIFALDKPGGLDTLIQVWDIKTHKEVRHFEADVALDRYAALDRNQRALSPGRRYLALASRKYDRVLLYDLTTGELAGELPLPAGAKTLGLSFAPDGKQLAGLFQVGDTKRLLAWNLNAATASARFKLDQEAVPNVQVYQGPVLDWLPDGSGWVVYGRRIIDAKSGAYYWPIAAKDSDWTPRRIFPDSRLAFVNDDRGKRYLAIEPLEKEKMEEALKRVRATR